MKACVVNWQCLRTSNDGALSRSIILKEQMKKFGADAVLMSGSGPTVFGLVEHESRVPRIYNGLKGFCQEVYAIRMIGERHSLD